MGGAQVEAIYGTRPFTAAKQWSAGEVPKIEYDKEYETPYDVTKLTEKPAPGQASIDAFFTTRGKDLFAILPRWPGRRFTVKDAGALDVKSVVLLGSPALLEFAKTGTSITVELPDLPEELLGQPAWVLKLGR